MMISRTRSSTAQKRAYLVETFSNTVPLIRRRGVPMVNVPIPLVTYSV